ncbi:MAG: hypothetical protein ACLSCV_04615 [Acutalibacteraceae bacterium]
MSELQCSPCTDRKSIGRLPKMAIPIELSVGCKCCIGRYYISSDENQSYHVSPSEPLTISRYDTGFRG